MNITRKQEGTTLEFALEGRLDTASVPEAEEVLLSSLDGVEKVILDFAEVEYISSAGLRLLVALQKELYGNGRLEIINANELVKEVFNVTGLVNILTIL